MDTELTTAYYKDCGGITGWWLTPAEAARLFAAHRCEGSLRAEFVYWGAADEDVKLVKTVVTLHSIDFVPFDERVELKSRARAEAKMHAEAEETGAV